MNRRSIPTDKHNRFILGELELLNWTNTQDSVMHMLRRRIEACLDIDILRGWLNDCEKHEHEVTTDLELFRGGFRLLDVEEARLVEKTEPCEYLALSYVWGSHDPDGLKTTRSNLANLKSLCALENSVQSIGKRVPRTIADAMSLCKDIGHRYLWVDCLCIVQDDEEEKQRLIHGMGHVYENASLTLFAITGQHADTGLAGITPREDSPYEKQYEIKGQDNSLSILIVPICLEEQVRKSPWNTRAWTLQEQTLSERRLYFTANEMFFECSVYMLRECYIHYHESFSMSYVKHESPVWGRGRKISVHMPLTAVLPRGTSSIWHHSIYASMVSSYSRRELSYTDDVLNAFSGIFERCTFAHQPQRPILAIQGLNDACFAKSLLWFIAEPNPARIRRRYMVHGNNLASWSWASWVAPIDFVCIYESSFPGPRVDNLHISGNRYFVTEWTLTTSDGNGTSKTTIKTEEWNSAAWPSDTDVLKPDRLVAMLPRKPQLLNVVNDAVGSTRFVAPCIAFPAGFRLVTDAKISLGGHLLILPERKEYCSVVKFDSDDKAFTEFPLVLFDGSYVALCVRTEGDISRRIGVAQFSRWENDWKTALEEGLLHLAWKQICLV
ncbi:heterokaryon incompatibility protein-domain-containing protein [Paraphoma chrysanthemicola]|nr:heterokaryon incompatibility protein-domain-containing protein [Paraphoma chrysanthemicola]